MSKLCIHLCLILLTNSALADTQLLNTIRTAFKHAYVFEEGAFDDTAERVSYSKGEFFFKDDLYKIIIHEPLAEEYILEDSGLTVIDNEFDQKEFIPISEIQNPFIALLLLDEPNLLEAITTQTANVFKISHRDFPQPLEIILTNNRIELIKYIDQLNVTHIINFSSA